MIRVAHVLDGKHFGGAEEALARLARHLAPDRAAIEAVLMHEGRLAERLRAQGTPVTPIPPLRHSGLRALLALVRLIRERRFDIVHTHAAGASLVARVACRMAGKAHVATVHSPIRLDINDKARGRRLHETLDRMGRRLSSRIVFVSEEEWKRSGNDRSVWIPNGVAMEEAPAERVAALRADWEIPADRKVIMMLAQLRPRKGPEILLQAMPATLRTAPEALAVFVGDAEFVASRDYLAELKKLAADLGVSESVKFVGFCRETRAALELSDVVALPSRFGEGLPLALLEAMSAGKPMAVTDVPGNREAVRNDVNGLLSPPEDPEAFARSLIRLLRDDLLRRRLGEEGRRIAAGQYDIRLVARRHEELYESIATGRGGN